MSFSRTRFAHVSALFFFAAAMLCGVTAAQAQNTRARQSPAVSPGIDTLRSNNFAPLAGKRVGLLSHPAGVDRNGVPSWKILADAPNVNLTALFAVEHGIDGTAPANVYIESRQHGPSGLPVFSLYGKTRSPSAAMLDKIDVFVIDMQDVGSRSYTYISAMKRVMEACFKAGKEVVVLDRPNPLGGLKVDGPPMDKEFMSYVGDFQIPYVHGLTIGELALMAKRTPGWLNISEQERQRGRLQVIAMQGWRRDMLWADTGLQWIPTSPNVPTFGAAMGYAMTGLGAQIGPFSHGIGTPFPFRLLRYPGKSAQQLASALNALNLPGMQFKPLQTRAIKSNQPVEGVYTVVTDWRIASPTRLSLEMMRLTCLWELERGEVNPFVKASENQASLFNKHMGSAQWWQAITRQGARVNTAHFANQWQRQSAQFQERSRPFWLYR